MGIPHQWILALHYNEHNN
uniref:Uncharacterized protein n=1 Tax=Rhizophora mucronata TaxID=61149 RepID=A0A2P2PS43_RHIMU